MRYDDRDDYNNRYGSRDSRSRSSSSYDSRGSSSRSSRDSYRSGSYDRSGRDSYRSGGSYGSYDDRYDRGYGYSDYDRRYSQPYDRYGGRTRSFDNFDEENWRRTAPNWVDHSEPDPPPRRRTSDRGSGRDDRRRSSDYDRRSSSSRSRSSSGRAPAATSRRSDDRRRSSDYDRRGSSSRSRNSRQRNDRRRSTGINPLPIILLIVVIVLAAVLIHTFFGGGGKDKYTISFSTQNIVVGDTAEATLNGVENADSVEVVWSSSDNNVVSVSGDGVVCTLSAKSTGQATIGATIDGETVASGSVVVVDTAPGVEDIRLTQEQVSIEAGSQYTIQATVVMEKDDMPPAKIRWSSSDTSVAQVSDNGVIEGRQVGQAIIKGTAGEKTAELVVTVTENTSNTKVDQSGTVGQEPEEGVSIPAEADTTVDPNNSETAGTGTTGTGTTTTGTGTTGTGAAGTGTTGTEATGGTAAGTTDAGTAAEGDAEVVAD